VLFAKADSKLNLVSMLFLLSSIVNTERFLANGVQVSTVFEDTVNCMKVFELESYTSEMKQADWTIMRLEDSETDYYKRKFALSSYKLAVDVSANLIFQEVHELKTNQVTQDMRNKHLVLSSTHSDEETVIFRPVFYRCENGK
jgi:DUF438 domain-containing protein